MGCPPSCSAEGPARPARDLPLLGIRAAPEARDPPQVAYTPEFRRIRYFKPKSRRPSQTAPQPTDRPHSRELGRFERVDVDRLAPRDITVSTAISATARPSQGGGRCSGRAAAVLLGARAVARGERATARAGRGVARRASRCSGRASNGSRRPRCWSCCSGRRRDRQAAVLLTARAVAPGERAAVAGSIAPTLPSTISPMISRCRG